jgi:hypothetical protein
MELNTSNAFWYEADSSEDMARSMCAQVKYLRDNQLNTVEEENLLNVRLYGNAEIFGLNPYDYTSKKSDARIGLNVIKQACDTATARIAKSKPRPQFLTENGDYKLKKEAKKLQRYVDGTFYENKAYQMGQEVFRDGTIVGKGCVKFFPAGSKIGMERVFVNELLVDQAESMYGKPSILYQRKVINKRILKGMYANKKTMITNTPTIEDSTLGGIKLSQMVEVIEAWKLPSYEDAGDGLHIIATEKGILMKEEWDIDWFPFEFFDWSKRVFGWYSSGISDELRGIQLEINKLLIVIQRAMHLGSVPKVFLDANSKIVKAHINNEIGGIITYSGIKPQYDQLMAVPPVLFEQLANLYTKAFEIVGLSQMSVTGQKPAGLDSGKALRTYKDIETERFSVVAQNYDQFFVDMANKLILMSERESKKKGSKLKVTSFNSKFIEPIAWKDINIKRDQYVLKTFPTNFLSSTPEGKFSDVSDLMGLGMLDQREAMSLLDYPDLEGVTEYKNAQFDDIHFVLEQIVDDGIYNPPMPYQALDYGSKLFQQVYVKLKNQKLEPERLEMLLRWGEDASLLIAKATAQNPQPMVPQQTSVNGGGAQTIMGPPNTQTQMPVPVIAAGRIPNAA